MRTHIDIDDALLHQVQQLGSFSTKKAAINAALYAFVNQLKRQELLALRGKVRWTGDLEQLRAQRRKNP